MTRGVSVSGNTCVTAGPEHPVWLLQGLRIPWQGAMGPKAVQTPYSQDGEKGLLVLGWGYNGQAL